MANQKQINFDMDGTLAAFYSVEGWLECLQASDPTPYKVAKPMLNMNLLAKQIHRLQTNGYEVNIISWLSKTSTPSFDEAVTAAKLAWLRKHLKSVKFNRISIVPYGTPKETLGEGILFDDEERNRKSWAGTAHDVQNILGVLKSLN